MTNVTTKATMEFSRETNISKWNYARSETCKLFGTSNKYCTVVYCIALSEVESTNLTRLNDYRFLSSEISEWNSVFALTYIWPSPGNCTTISSPALISLLLSGRTLWTEAALTNVAAVIILTRSTLKQIQVKYLTTTFMLLSGSKCLVAITRLSPSINFSMLPTLKAHGETLYTHHASPLYMLYHCSSFIYFQHLRADLFCNNAVI